jgi:hypothetical protein
MSRHPTDRSLYTEMTDGLDAAVAAGSLPVYGSDWSDQEPEVSVFTFDPDLTPAQVEVFDDLYAGVKVGMGTTAYGAIKADLAVLRTAAQDAGEQEVIRRLCRAVLHLYRDGD